MKKLFSIFRYAALDQNGIVVQLLGLYPAVVLATSGKEGLIMGLFITLLLSVSGFLFSLFRHLMTEGVRLCVLALIVGTQCAAISLFMKAYFPTFFSTHQIFFEMLCVTGLVFARGESFTRYHNAVKSFADSFGTGIGYTAILFVLGLLREFLGQGTLFTGSIFQFHFSFFKPLPLLLEPAGGLLVLGALVAIFGKVRRMIQKKEEKTL